MWLNLSPPDTLPEGSDLIFRLLGQFNSAVPYQLSLEKDVMSLMPGASEDLIFRENAFCPFCLIRVKSPLKHRCRGLGMQPALFLITIKTNIKSKR